MEGINFPAEKDDWKEFKKNKVRIALNVLYAKKDKIYPAYFSKDDSNHEKQIILLRLSTTENWYYLAVKKLSTLLRGITSKNNGDFYYLHCLHCFRTENKLGLHKSM